MAKFSVVPSKIKIDIEIPDPDNDTAVIDDSGNIVEPKTTIETFIAYRKGAGTPLPVVVEVDEAYKAYEENFPAPALRETMSTSAYLYATRKANAMLMRDILLAAIPGMNPDVANTLAGDDGQGGAVLEFLGWWNVGVAEPDAKVEETGKADDDEDNSGEALGEVGTGESTSPS